ncbi:hypothetical protein EG68_09541 [Paragonimus skrjabini miyazakii]|uniref:Transmembrane protein n=1 Tax=Paragonimus skrjabini miyazakii TaxID=59628 RepID=A0A8S9YH92_9TREM|nr:hypothetical protein EG68_09541 [Paragonimus skrjabini miyazakii]
MDYRPQVGADLSWNKEELDVVSLAYDLSDWTGFILKIEGLLNWEAPRLLIAVLLTVSGIFLMFHWYHPNVLSTVGWFGLVWSLIDFVGPALSARRYREFCRRLVHARYLVINFVIFLRDLRTRHPVVYLFTCLSLLFICGFVASHFSDLVILYVLVMMCILTPGLRHTGFFKLCFHPIVRLGSATYYYLPKQLRNIPLYVSKISLPFRWITALYRTAFPNKKD